MTRWFLSVVDFLVVAYQHSLSHLMSGRCRFYPSCSAYARMVLAKEENISALGKIAWRISKCHPLHPGGIDLP